MHEAKDYVTEVVIHQSGNRREFVCFTYETHSPLEFYKGVYDDPPSEAYRIQRSIVFEHGWQRYVDGAWKTVMLSFTLSDEYNAAQMQILFEELAEAIGAASESELFSGNLVKTDERGEITFYVPRSWGKTSSEGYKVRTEEAKKIVAQIKEALNNFNADLLKAVECNRKPDIKTVDRLPVYKTPGMHKKKSRLRIGWNS